MASPDLEKESPESWSEEFGADGIETLPRRVDRYGKAKSHCARCSAVYRRARRRSETLHQRLTTCGDYLLFRHYFTIDAVRLHAASFCMKHLLCSLCAPSDGGAKAMKAYLDRWEVIRAENGL
jgi:hypothetical protein